MRMAVIGPGTIGTHVALLGARRGFQVDLIGRDAERARVALNRAIDSTGERTAGALIEIRTDLTHAVAEADIIYEAIHERLEEKRALYAEIEPAVKSAVPIVSGTSTIGPVELGAELLHGDRVFVAHFVHPVTTVALAEVIEPPTPQPAAHATFRAWIDAMGLAPMVLDRAITGFIVNRLQFALLREALSLVANGVAEARDIDRVITDGLGPRWVATGPLASMDIGGIELFRDVARLVAPTLENGTMIEHLSALIERGATGALSGQGTRAWTAADRQHAADARKRSYAFAAELHAEGPIPNDG